MRYQLLGRSGLKVSELCLGTMTFGEDWGWGASRDESRRVYDAFLGAGGNFIDTANVYTNGSSESLLGEFMQGHRQKIVLATKYTNRAPGVEGPNAAGNSRKSMFEAVEASLRRLKTDYIDLYWLHIWDFLTPIEEVMRAFDDLVRQGKVLYVGISDAAAWIVSRAQTLAELRGWSPIAALQIEYSLVERTPERELLPMAEALGLSVTPWSPLAGGVLTGKYATGQGGQGRYADAMMRQFQNIGHRVDGIVREVLEIARECGRSPAQVALAWLRQRPRPVIPIIGARKAEQFADNLACLTLRLDAPQVERLDRASAIELGFPHDFYGRDMVRALVYAGYRDRIDARLP
jgi:aryl-alcohol dehydrogenase-like predicted oxidoreductase